MVNIATYAEGPTEWYTIWQLRKRNILSAAELVGYDERGNISRWLVPRDKVRKKIGEAPEWDRILLVYDQERHASPSEVAKRIAGDAFEFESVRELANVFQGHLGDRQIVLHVATAQSPDGNRDFDGYAVRLLEQLGDQASQLWFESRIESRNGRKKYLLPDYLREERERRQIEYAKLHNLGMSEIPALMGENGLPILRSKGHLYAYITAIQANKSHVWFTEKLIKVAPSEILDQIFTSLIAAWNLLLEGDAR